MTRRRRQPGARALAVLALLVLGPMWAVAAAPSVAAADDCPGLPITLAELIAVDEDPGPLSVAFRPVYGYYGERAYACFADQDIAVTGFVARPEGLGGVSAFTIEPAWFVSRAHFIAATARTDPDIGPVGPFLAVAVPPTLEGVITGFQGRWVTVTGHFGDSAADGCVVTTGTPGPDVPSAAQAVEICAGSFVLTRVEAALPPTDAVATPIPVAISHRELAAWLACIGGAVVGAVAGARLAIRPRRAR